MKADNPLDGVLPPARRIAWSAGIPGGIPDVPVAANVKDFGAAGDGKQDDTASIVKAIASVNNGGAVLFPAGTYLITSTLQINKSIVLRGEGADQTTLAFNTDGDAIDAMIYHRGTWVPILDGYTANSNVLHIQDATGFTAGSFIEIQQDNDPAIMYTKPDWNVSWAAGAVGQIDKVASVDGGTITLEEPLHLTYRSELNPVIRTQGFLSYVGVERLHLKRIDTSDSYMIWFKNTAYAWMREVHTELARKAHINTETVYRCEIRDNYFDDATDHVGGGEGYGVEMGLHTTNCLVENNIFRHLRHAMIVHLGANGNVFTYNYARENFQDQQPGVWTPPDISIHGHFAYANLFDSNIVQQIAIGDSWGPGGPYNTFCRNRVESSNSEIRGAKGRAIDVGDSSQSQNFIGNELVIGAITLEPTIQDSLMQGNYTAYNKALDGAVGKQDIPPSCYYTSAPPFYGQTAWPSVGADRLNGTIPAKERWLAGQYIPLPANQ